MEATSINDTEKMILPGLHISDKTENEKRSTLRKFSLTLAILLTPSILDMAVCCPVLRTL